MTWFLTPDDFLKKTPQTNSEKHIIDLYEVTPQKMWDMIHNGQVDHKAFKAWFEIHSSAEIPKR